MITFRKEEYEKIEDGEYIAELTEVKENVTKQPSQYGPSLRFSFKLLEPPYFGRTVSGLTTVAWKAGNKLDEWLTALGVELGAVVGTELSAERVVGQKVRVYLESNPKGDFTNVKKVKPLRATDLARVAEIPHVAQSAPVPEQVVSPIQTPATNVVLTATTVVPTPVAQPTQVAPQVPVTNPTPSVSTPKLRNIPF